MPPSFPVVMSSRWTGEGVVSLGPRVPVPVLREGGRATRRMSRWLSRHHKTVNRGQTHCACLQQGL